VVLATDGVTENIARSELAGIIRGAASPNEAAVRLNTMLETRRAADRPAALYGRGFQRDDWTAIVRFFSAADELAMPAPARPTPSAAAPEPSTHPISRGLPHKEG